ncbi:MAG: hypothetical protein C0601_02805 [Candidatus Muiribacterium halophilum]|uniref:Uncharacterized protein n=1 Tax=Muiribacterium halophilum TaxID=2053465 RepID=A0A2N5ZK05_MUIH1|nr:MAG: hypothetical protein C0601_02805 [Candidatus Muirbacterium halophilum]
MIKFTTYVSPTVFVMDSKEISVKYDSKLFNEIESNTNLERKVFRYNGERIYIDYFIAGFSWESMNSFLEMERNVESDLYTEIIKKAKKKYFSEYIKNFKRGYIDASKYFKKTEDPDKILEKIFFVPFLGNGSPEEYSYVLGSSIANSFFQRYEDSLRFKKLTSKEIKEFIEGYSYTFGVVAYIRTRYVEE